MSWLRKLIVNMTQNRYSLSGRDSVKDILDLEVFFGFVLGENYNSGCSHLIVI